MKHSKLQNSVSISRAGSNLSGLFLCARNVLLSLLLIFALTSDLTINAAFAEDTETETVENARPTDIKAILPGGPSIDAGGAVVMEVNSGAILYTKNPTASYEPTSLTKLVTCLIAMESTPYDDTVECSYTAINGIGTGVTRVGLVVEERLPLRDMLYASLVASADEATYAIGEKVSGNMKEFVTRMNSRVKMLGGVNSNFLNCMGTSKDGMYSCAYDLGLVACKIAQQPDFFTIAGARWYEIPATNKMESRIIAQTQKFIRKTRNYAYAKAGKSGGQSKNGKYSLCTYAEKDGMTLVAIVLDSETNDGSYDDTETILNWAFENYEVYSVREAEAGTNNSYTGLFDKCPMFSQESMKDLVYTSNNASIVLPTGSDLSGVTKDTTYYNLDEYFHGENVIGAVIYHYNEAIVGKRDIIFWNSEYPMSQVDFDAVWPKFMIPPKLLPSQGGTGELPEVIGNAAAAATPTPTPYKPPSTSTEDAPDTEDTPATDGSEVTTEGQSVGSLTPTVTPTPAITGTKDINKKKVEAQIAKAESHNKKMRYLSLGLFIGTYVICLTVIYIILPMRRRKKRKTRT